MRTDGNGSTVRTLLYRVGGIGAAALTLGAQAWAQATADGGAGPTAPRARDLPGGILSTLLFGMIGIVLTIIGFKLFDLAIRSNLEKEICENNNTAAAILAGFVILGVSLIVGATILSD